MRFLRIMLALLAAAVVVAGLGMLFFYEGYRNDQFCKTKTHQSLDRCGGDVKP